MLLNNRLCKRSFLRFFVGVPLVKKPQGVTAATGGEPRPSPPP